MKNFKGMQKYAAGGATIDTTQFMPSMTAETSMLDGGRKKKRPKPPRRNITNRKGSEQCRPGGC